MKDVTELFYGSCRAQELDPETLKIRTPQPLFSFNLWSKLGSDGIIILTAVFT